MQKRIRVYLNHEQKRDERISDEEYQRFNIDAGPVVAEVALPEGHKLKGKPRIRRGPRVLRIDLLTEAES